MDRIKKVNELIKEEVSKIILEEIDDPRLRFVTITSVETTPDLRKSTLWVSFLEKEKGEMLSALEQNLRKIQSILNKKLTMRYVPKIEFKHDVSQIYAQYIEELLKEVKGGEKKNS